MSVIEQTPAPKPAGEKIIERPILQEEVKETPAAPKADMVVEVKLEAESVQDMNELLSMEKSLELETDTTEVEPTFEELFKPAGSIEKPEVPKETKTEADDIEKALISIDTEIESGGPVKEGTPNIDVEDVRSKQESLRKLGEVMRGYVPGKNLDDEGKQPIDPNIWK